MFRIDREGENIVRIDSKVGFVFFLKRGIMLFQQFLSERDSQRITPLKGYQLFARDESIRDEREKKGRDDLILVSKEEGVSIGKES